MKPERPHSYLQTMSRARQRRIQILQILLALAVLAALMLTRPAPAQKSMSPLGGSAQPAALRLDWALFNFAD